MICGSWITRDVETAQLATIDFALRAETIDEATRSVDVVLATEDALRAIDPMTGEAFEEILLMRGAVLPGQVPLLDSHNRFTTEAIRGSIRQLRVEGDQLIARLFFGDDEESVRAWGLVKNGHLRSVSVGAQRQEVVRLEPGERRTVDGRTFTAGEIPLQITTRWLVREGSLVAVGLDPRAVVRTQTPRSTEAKDVNPQLRALLESIGLERGASDADAWEFYHKLSGDDLQRAQAALGDDTPPARRQAAQPAAQPAQQPAQPAQQPAQPAPQPQTVDRAEVARVERQRIREIERLAGDDVDRDLVTRAIDESWEVERASREFLAQIRDRRSNTAGASVAGGGQAPAGHARDRDSDVTRETLGAALMVRGGLALDCEHFGSVSARQALHRQHATRFLALGVNDDQRQRIMDLAHRFADMHAIDICRECIRMDGAQAPHARDEIIQRAFSGGSLANVFTTSAYAQLIASYMEHPDTTMGWVRETDVQNFQSQERPRLQKGGGLQKLPRGGTAEHRGFDDDVETYKIARYAEMFVVDDQDVQDDRLNALRDVPMEMGADARRIRPDLVYSILFANDDLADGTALFASGRSNLRTNAALAFATLQNAILDLTTQTEGGVNLNLRPTHLIAPWTLAFTAAQILTSTETRSEQDAGTEVGTRNAINVIAGALNRVHDSRLDNGVTDPDSGTTHSGATGDYFLADSNRPGIEVGYLAGTGRSPSMRSFVLDKGQYGIGFDVKVDVGAKAIRALSLHKSEE